MMPWPRCTNPEHESLGRSADGRCIACRREGERRRQARFAATAKGRVVQRRYWASDKGKAARARYESGLKRGLAHSRYNRKQELQHALEAIDEVR